MTVYRTAEVARRIGIHPNTVRLYEELKLIPRPQRLNCPKLYGQHKNTP